MSGEAVKEKKRYLPLGGSGNKIQTYLKSRWALACLAVLGIILLMWPVSSSRQGTTKPEQSALSSGKGTSVKADMERELAGILSQIEGAGQVEVSLTLVSEGVNSYAVNTKEQKTSSEETDKDGGVRKTTDTNTSQDLVVMGSQSPLLVEKKAPQVKGVLVVADGAANPAVKEQITRAVETLLDLPATRVLVLPRE
ncbi:MAG: hypothetical protein HPY90_01170 [Syntrophothermus sp.]|uniref:hypothetical protein n=1 Tax=Syntrophothermus sp. TaxID=2736299 RepID=UPI00257A0773|nr:hypothetical protein [Syntrophothermus sp.]NSW81874.1 hypothetical protein [Syntrophothermus sp.]